jgi:MoxR-like ATPase
MDELAMDPGWFQDRFDRLQQNIEMFIQGKSDVVHLALVCLFAEGHLLIEDVPGVGKTSLAKAMALSINGTLQRIQFTPDLLPSDVTGVQVYNSKTTEFEFHPGGVFANLVVADEINRASPKTQSALLEVMEEHQVTVDAKTYPVPEPFMVIATQNPIEHDGTYRLPEAQIDRFMMRLSIGYPDLDAEMRVLANRARGASTDDLGWAVDLHEVDRMIGHVHAIAMSDALTRYICMVCAATRTLAEIRLGVSPRGTLALGMAARAHAASRGRPFVSVDDVKAVIEPVLAHRILLTPSAQLERVDVGQLLGRVMAAVPVPSERARV